jgi:hypothetical protein
VRIELPTPDIVVVRDGTDRVMMFADTRLAQAEVDAPVADLDAIMAGWLTRWAAADGSRRSTARVLTCSPRWPRSWTR